MTKYRNSLAGFLDFIRERGVVSLAIGFILGGAVTKVVTSLVNDIINPVLGIVLGYAGGLTKVVIHVGSAQIKIGSFISVLIDFVVIALVVYYGVKIIGLDKLDKKTEKPEKK
jgi:large conductance mechanosensitive channel